MPWGCNHMPRATRERQASLRRRTTFHLILPLVEILLRDAVCGDEDVAGVEQRPGAAQPLGGPGAV